MGLFSKFKEKFIKKFWETAKGQAILRHAKYVAHEYFEAKKEYEG